MAVPTPEDDDVCSSVVSIQWLGGVVAVDKIRLILRDTSEEEDDKQNQFAPGASEVRLAPCGEYIKSIHGRLEIFDGRAADWITICTNTREVNIGLPGCFTPTFSYYA